MSRVIIIQEERCALYESDCEEEEENGKKRKCRDTDVSLWVLLTLLLAVIIVICVSFTYVAVNTTRNLGTTLISEFQFYPGQFLQNEKYFFNFTPQGILQLSSATEGIYWESTNENGYSLYGLVCNFKSDASLLVENYYGQVLWSLNATDMTHMPPFILFLNKSGQIIIRSSLDGAEVSSLPTPSS